MDKQKKRTRRTPEQLIDMIDGKLQKQHEELESLAAKRDAANQEFDRKEAVVKERIAALEQKRKDVLKPKMRKPRKTKKQKIQELIKSASKAGLKPEEIAQRLGLDQPEE